MLLAIDIGNTNIVIGAFTGDVVAARWRLATQADRTVDEYAVLLESLFRLAKLSPDEVSGCVIASGVPDLQTTMQLAVRGYLSVEPLVVSSNLNLGIDVCYAPPEAVGADRVANALAVRKLFGVPAVVVDFGTATTFDAVSADGDYLGGAIAPGLEISVDALISHAALLPRVSLEAPPAAIGMSTRESLQSGIIYGYAGLVDGLVDRFSKELGSDIQVVATGGLAPVVAPYSQSIQHVDQDLTLIGLAIIYAQNVPQHEPERHEAGAR